MTFYITVTKTKRLSVGSKIHHYLTHNHYFWNCGYVTVSVCAACHVCEQKISDYVHVFQVLRNSVRTCNSRPGPQECVCGTDSSKK